MVWLPGWQAHISSLSLLSLLGGSLLASTNNGRQANRRRLRTLAQRVLASSTKINLALPIICVGRFPLPPTRACMLLGRRDWIQSRGCADVGRCPVGAHSTDGPTVRHPLSCSSLSSSCVGGIRSSAPCLPMHSMNYLLTASLKRGQAHSSHKIGQAAAAAGSEAGARHRLRHGQLWRAS